MGPWKGLQVVPDGLPGCQLSAVRRRSVPPHVLALVSLTDKADLCTMEAEMVWPLWQELSVQEHWLVTPDCPGSKCLLLTGHPWIQDSGSKACMLLAKPSTPALTVQSSPRWHITEAPPLQEQLFL